MTGAALNVPTLDAVTSERAQAQAELAELQRKLAAIPAELDRLDEQVAASGSQEAIRTQAALRVSARKELPKEIAALETRVQTLLAEEQQLRDRAFVERGQRADATVSAAVEQEWNALGVTLDAAARQVGRHFTALERKAARAAERTGNREAARQLIQRESAAGLLLAFGETLARWAAHDPQADWDFGTLDRISGPLGLWLRRLRDAFLNGRGVQQ